MTVLHVLDGNTGNFIPVNITDLGDGTYSISTSFADEVTVTVSGFSTETTAQAILSALSSVPVTGPLTDTQLRASAVPVSASALPLPTGAATQTTVASILSALANVAVTGPLTDTQLRAASVAVSASSLPLPTGAATQTTLGAIEDRLDDPLTVGSSRKITATFTRPANTTPYTAGDGITTATSSAAGMVFTGASTGVVVGATAYKSNTVTTNSFFRIWLYHTPTGIAIPNDNEAYSPAVIANRAALAGILLVDFSIGAVGSDGAIATCALSSERIILNPPGTELLAIWEAREAYTPISGEVFYLTLDYLED